MGVRALSAVEQHDPPVMSINVGGRLVNGAVQGGTDITGAVLDYSYTTDIISFTDTCAINIANPNGLYSTKVGKGSPFYLYMSSPEVNGGAKVLRMTGLVVNPRMTSKGGEKIQLQCADRGWYLERCDGPLWCNLSGTKDFDTLIKRLLQGPRGEDFKWGFQQADGSLQVKIISNSGLRTKLNQGRAGFDRSVVARAERAQNPKAFVPPIQIDTGGKVGSYLIDYARRSHLLVNVASDGTLIFWAPTYADAASYRFDYHPPRDDGQPDERNNCFDIEIDDSVDGIATDVTCVSVKTQPIKDLNPEDPNADKFRRRYVNRPAATHYMRETFGDSNQMTGAQAATRAKWRQQRAQFDAFQMKITAYGHVQNGIFYTPDTMVAVNDTVHNVVGSLYCSACQYTRDPSGGTRTVLTLRLPNVLAA
jgi:hypothetical protein